MIRHKSIYVHTLTLYKRYKQIRSHIIKQYNHKLLTHLHSYIKAYIPTYIHAARMFSARMAANYRCGIDQLASR